MGGPSAGVLLRRRLSRSELEQVLTTIRSVSNRVEPINASSYDFWVNDMRPLGGSYLEPGAPGRVGRPFVFSLRPGDTQPDWYVLEPEQIAPFSAAFGFEPQQEVEFAAMGKGDGVNEILGGLVLHVAELFDRAVHLGGALLPGLPEPFFKDGWLWEKANWSDVEPYFTAMVKDMPGRIVGFPYETHNGRTWASHIADATFLRAWMAHPDSYMIK
jgi:hypothetical protein